MKNYLVLTTILFGLTLCLSPVLGQSATKEGTAKVQQKAKSKDGVESKDGAKKDPKQLAKENDIRKLLVATGAGKMGVQVMQQMFASIKAQNPSIPANYFDDIMKEVDPNELIEISIPSYDNHLTHEEIKELIKFYESPIGKKLIEKQPLIMRDAMVAGQAWGMDLNRRIQEKMQADF